MPENDLVSALLQPFRGGKKHKVTAEIRWVSQCIIIYLTLKVVSAAQSVLFYVSRLCITCVSACTLLNYIVVHVTFFSGQSPLLRVLFDPLIVLVPCMMHCSCLTGCVDLAIDLVTVHADTEGKSHS